MSEHYSFELISFDITNTRSRHDDTDYTSFHLAVKNKNGGIRTYKQVKFNGNLNNGTYPIGLSFHDIAVESDEHIVMNYLIVNNGHEKGDSVAAELEKAGDSSPLRAPRQRGLRLVQRFRFRELGRLLALSPDGSPVSWVDCSSPTAMVLSQRSR